MGKKKKKLCYSVVAWSLCHRIFSLLNCIRIGFSFFPDKSVPVCPSRRLRCSFGGVRTHVTSVPFFVDAHSMCVSTGASHSSTSFKWSSSMCIHDFLIEWGLEADLHCSLLLLGSCSSPVLRISAVKACCTTIFISGR